MTFWAGLPADGRRLALALAAGILLVGGLAAIHVLVTPIEVFAPSGELADGLRIPALFSGALLAGASACALVAARGAARDRAERLSLAVVCGLFALLAVDELFSIHEKVDELSSLARGLYLAALGVGAVALVVIFWRHSDPEFRLPWAAGAAAWALSQLLDALHSNDGNTDLDLSGAAAGIEEVLEMTGSALFLLALYLLARRRENGG